MVKIMENPIKMDDLGGFPYFWFNTHMLEYLKTPATPTFNSSDFLFHRAWTTTLEVQERQKVHHPTIVVAKQIKIAGIFGKIMKLRLRINIPTMQRKSFCTSEISGGVFQ